MNLYSKILSNDKYLELVKQIEKIRFITDGKWDWEHGLGHYRRVSEHVKDILTQLGADNRTIDLGMIAALLHDLGMSKGDKVDHAVESGKIFANFIDRNDVTVEEMESLRQAIVDHSKGNNINSLIGLALVLADKLDVTYHRVENSSIHDAVNNEVLKIKEVDIRITDQNLIVNYTVSGEFDINILGVWPKAITIPYKVAKYLDKEFSFLVNGEKKNVDKFFG